MISVRDIFVGAVGQLGPAGVPSAFLKARTTGKVAVGRTGLAGDQQADLKVHGGPDMAVYVYPESHYGDWMQEFPEHAAIWRAGALGENFSISGCDEAESCIGDVVSFGSVVLQVSRPRKPCFKLALRFNDLRLPRRLVEAGRCGWYYRVIEQGEIAPGDTGVLLKRLNPNWTIRRVNDLSMRRDAAVDELQELSELAGLAANWRAQVKETIEAKKAASKKVGFRQMRVAAVKTETNSVKSYQFESLDGAALPAALPGQHIVVRPTLADGPSPKARCYSIVAASGSRVTIGVKNVGGGTSAWMHGNLQYGDTVDVMGPRGSFVHDTQDNRPLLLISAGIGITPMMFMLQAATTNNGSRQVPSQIVFLHCARSGTDHAFSAELESILARHPTVNRHIRYSRPDAADILGKSHDSVGRIDRQLVADAIAFVGECHIFVCGPDSFMDDVVNWARQCAIAEELIRTEQFNAGRVTSRDPDMMVPASAGAQIRFHRTDKTAHWAEGVSLLDLAETHGATVESDCRTGICGSCATRIVSGSVGYADEPLCGIPEGTALLCCAHPTVEELVLDA